MRPGLCISCWPVLLYMPPICDSKDTTLTCACRRVTTVRLHRAQDQAQLALSTVVDGIAKRLAAAVRNIGKLSDVDLEAAADAAEQDDTGDNQVRGCST